MTQERITAISQAISQVLEIASSLIDELDDETMLALTELLNQANETIMRLKNPSGEMPTPAEPALDQKYPSSNIHSFGYDPENERLLVKFQGDYPQQNGPIYGYDNVPKVIFDLFQKGSIPARTDGKNKWGKWWRGKVPSLGASLYTLIKNGGYSYTRLT